MIQQGRVILSSFGISSKKMGADFISNDFGLQPDSKKRWEIDF
jgi:hypothetical protein